MPLSRGEEEAVEMLLELEVWSLPDDAMKGSLGRLSARTNSSFSRERERSSSMGLASPTRILLSGISSSERGDGSCKERGAPSL